MKDSDIINIETGAGEHELSGDHEQGAVTHKTHKHVNDVRVECWGRGHQDNIMAVKLELCCHISDVGDNAGVGDVHHLADTCGA